jgi:hypothetical protein
MNGGKSHALHKGAPGPTALYVSASRKGAASEHAKVALPFDGMQSFKGAACWCKKCAGSKSGQDNHSRMGCSPPSAVYPNCALYKSDVRLSKVQKRARTLAAPDDGGGGPARRCRARREDGQALPTEPADASAPGTNQVRAAQARVFLGGNGQVITVMDALIFEVEVRAQSALICAQHQESDDACDAATAKLIERCGKVPTELILGVKKQRALQVARDPSFGSKLHFEADKPPTCEVVELGGKDVELVIKPSVAAQRAAGRRIYLVDLDTRKRHQPPDGLSCWRCGSRDLTVRLPRVLSLSIRPHASADCFF